MSQVRINCPCDGPILRQRVRTRRLLPARTNVRYRRILVVAARSGEGPFTNRFVELSPRPPFLGQDLRVFTGRQLECLPNMIQLPLLRVVNAASAVSARTLTCRAPAVPRSCSMLSVYMAVRVRPFPKLPPLEQNGCGPSTLISPA